MGHWNVRTFLSLSSVQSLLGRGSACREHQSQRTSPVCILLSALLRSLGSEVHPTELQHILPFTALALTPILHCVMIDMLNCTGWPELESVSNTVLITHECWQMSIPVLILLSDWQLCIYLTLMSTFLVVWRLDNNTVLVTVIWQLLKYPSNMKITDNHKEKPFLSHELQVKNYTRLCDHLLTLYMSTEKNIISTSRNKRKPGTVAHTYNPGTQEAEAGVSLWAQGQFT